MEIGERIRLAREAVVMTKSELARRVGVHPSACIQWESEGGTHPKMEHLAHVAVVLDVRFEWLATGRGEMRYDSAVREERPAYSGTQSRLTSDEQRLLELYRGLSPRKRKSLLEVVDGMATGREDNSS